MNDTTVIARNYVPYASTIPKTGIYITPLTSGDLYGSVIAFSIHIVISNP